MGEEAGSEGWIEAGSEALALQGTWGLVSFENVEGGVADHREIEGESPCAFDSDLHRR